MKKYIVFMLLVLAAVVHAGYDLKIDGKFKRVRNGQPDKWSISTAGAAKIVRGEDFGSRALELTSGNEIVKAVSKGAFPVRQGNVIEVDAEIKGTGKAFIAVELLNEKGEIISVKRIAERNAASAFMDIKGKLRLDETPAPEKIRIILGVEPGAKVAFDDVDAEIDND